MTNPPTDPIFLCIQQFTNVSFIISGVLVPTAGDFSNIQPVTSIGLGVIGMFLRQLGNYWPFPSEKHAANYVNAVLWIVCIAFIAKHLASMAFAAIDIQRQVPRISENGPEQAKMKAPAIPPKKTASAPVTSPTSAKPPKAPADTVQPAAGVGAQSLPKKSASSDDPPTATKHSAPTTAKKAPAATPPKTLTAEDAINMRVERQRYIKMMVHVLFLAIGGLIAFVYVLADNNRLASLMFRNTFYTTLLFLPSLMFLLVIVILKFILGEYRRTMTSQTHKDALSVNHKDFGSFEIALYTSEEETRILSSYDYFMAAFRVKRAWILIIYLSIGRCFEVLGDGTGGSAEVMRGLAGLTIYAAVALTLLNDAVWVETKPGKNERAVFTIVIHFIYTLAFIFALVPQENMNNYMSNQTDDKEPYGWKMFLTYTILVIVFIYHVTTFFMGKCWKSCPKCCTQGHTKYARIPVSDDRDGKDEDNLRSQYI